MYFVTFLSLNVFVRIIFARLINTEHTNEQVQSPISCNLSRSIENNGFHRDLDTKLMLTAENLGVTRHDCSVMIKEDLPAGIYLDLYQLTESQNYGGPKVFSSTEFDLEKPEYQSPPHTIFVYSDVNWKELTALVNITMAIHLRYHKPSEDKEFVRVKIPLPEFFIGCDEREDETKELFRSNPTSTTPLLAPCHHDDSRNCTWTKMICQSNSEDIAFDIPVGRLSDYFLVTVGTISITTITTAFLIQTMLRKSRYEVQ